MTPKEKAKELMQKAYDLDKHNKTPQSRCKEIALLCINEIQTFVPYETYKDTLCPYDGAELSMNYWDEVKHELSLL